tara:strand:+ start:287 stop:772 length:486 start_codon:yes stop_codon:yes gene_type:complete
MVNLKKETYLKILFLLSFAILSFAYAVQYLLEFQPCNLCIIERIPYFLALIVLLLNFKFKRDYIFYSILLLLIFAFSFFISVYHLAIEQGFINESTVCLSNQVDLIAKDEILKSLKQIKISCKNVAFKIFGLSLTAYNVLISIFMFLISSKIYYISNEIEK